MAMTSESGIKSGRAACTWSPWELQAGCLRLVVGGSRRTGRGDRDAARDSLLNCGCWARGWRSGQSLACRQAGWDEQGHVHVAVGERGQASDFYLVVDVERFGQVQGRASDQAVEVVGRPVFPQHRGHGVAVAVGVVSRRPGPAC